jgi:uncharacterized membrane protein (DUF485 family)
MKLLKYSLYCLLTAVAAFIVLPTAISVATSSPTGVLAFVGAFVVLAILHSSASK